MMQLITQGCATKKKLLKCESGKGCSFSNKLLELQQQRGKRGEPFSLLTLLFPLSPALLFISM
jgi:hypothetical protein